MHTNVRRGLLGTLFAGGLLALGTSVAYAADTTSGNDSLASGTQVIAPVTAPVTLGATSIGLLGDSAATTGGSNGTTAAAPANGTGGNTTSGDDSLASGTQVTAPVTAPVTLGATSIGLLGDSAATTGGGAGGAPAGDSGGTAGESAGGSDGTYGPAPSNGTGGNTTSGDEGTAAGTQVTAPVTAPVTLGATSAGLLGDSAAATGVPAEPGTGGAATPPGSHPGGASGGTSGDGSAAGAQCTAQSVGFVPAGHAAPITGTGTGITAAGAHNGASLAALALLCGGALLKLRRRSA